MAWTTRHSDVARWAVVAPASVGLGWLFDHLGVPAAWILAAIVCSAGMALASGREMHLPGPTFIAARGFVGILAALPLTTIAGSELFRFLLPGLVVSAVTVVGGVVGGELLHKAQPKAVSLETGILSTLPGGASMMPALANELGADYRYVALTQYLRMLTVASSLPLVTSLMAAPHPGGTMTFGAPSTPWWVILLIIAIALLGEKLGSLIRLPAPAVFGPLLLTVGISFLMPEDISLAPPEPFTIFAFLAIGWMCGGGLSLPALRLFAQQLPATIAFIVGIIGVCALTAFPLQWWMGITHFEAYLATSPGALETVLALAAEGGASAAVVAIQLIRLLIVLVVAAYLPHILGWVRKKRGP